jgi:hypothetical protein
MAASSRAHQHQRVTHTGEYWAPPLLRLGVAGAALGAGPTSGEIRRLFGRALEASRAPTECELSGRQDGRPNPNRCPPNGSAPTKANDRSEANKIKWSVEHSMEAAGWQAAERASRPP